MITYRRRHHAARVCIKKNHTQAWPCRHNRTAW